MPLDQASRAALAAMMQMPGWQVFKNLFEFQVVLLERGVFSVDPAQKEEVLANHRMAVGARLLYDNTLRDLDNKLKPETKQPQLTQKELEEIHIANL